MPRKAANSTTEFSTEHRRSSCIKEHPKEDPAPKKAPKPRTKKADKESTDKEEKPKYSRGKKRKAEEEQNGDVDDAAQQHRRPRKSAIFLLVAELNI
jgi:hypothetical protein